MRLSSMSFFRRELECCCGSDGEFLARRMINFPGCVNVDVGEVMGFVEALS